MSDVKTETLADFLLRCIAEDQPVARRRTVQRKDGEYDALEVHSGGEVPEGCLMVRVGVAHWVPGGVDPMGMTSHGYSHMIWSELTLSYEEFRERFTEPAEPTAADQHVLATLAAHRRIVQFCQERENVHAPQLGRLPSERDYVPSGYRLVMEMLAEAYADRPGWRDEWRRP